MTGKPQAMAAPADLVEQLFNQWEPNDREHFLRLFLQKWFDGQGGAKIIFAQGSDETAEFAIRAAGPPITDIKISDRIYSDEARAAVRRLAR